MENSPSADGVVKPKRKSLSVKTRFEVFKRDGFKCQYCGDHPPSVLLHVDHILAVASGGSNAADNLVTACAPCNFGKGARSLSAVPQSLADKAAETAEREAQLAGFQKIFESKRQRIDAEIWRVLEVLFGSGVDSVPQDHYSSTQRFVEKLGVHVCLESADATIAATSVRASNCFRYFCGICWHRVRELEK